MLRSPEADDGAPLERGASGDAERPALASIGLLLCRDLIFQSKIRGTAEALGYELVVVAGAELAKSQLATRQVRVVIVDLSVGEAASAAALGEYMEIAGQDVPFVGFGSHVDTKILAAARAAGCHEVMPRSKFSAELPAILKRYFDVRRDI